MTKVDLNIALKSPFAKRYENYIGGEWRAPKAGKYFDNISPITGQPVCEIARSDASDVEAALDAAHAAKEAWGRTEPGRTGAGAQQDRRPHRSQSGEDRARRNVGQRQADPRDDGRRHPARHRPFPLFRRRDPRSGRLDQRSRSRHRRLSFPRAARRRRSDHPVEFPDPDGRLEDGARAGGWKLHRSQARRTDPGFHHGSARDHRRPHSEGRAQRRQRLRPRSGQAARLVEPRRQDRLHRRDDDRPADHAICVAEPHSGDARTRREVAQHLLR